MAEFEELNRLPFIIDQLEAIQELHSLNTDWRRITRLDRCQNCYAPYPCPTRRLADDALTARTTKNGDA